MVGCSCAIPRPSLLFRQVGAHDFPFEACSGFTRVAARRLADPPMVDRCPESFDKSVILLAVSVATGANRQFPQAGLAPARALHLFTARRIIQARDTFRTSSPASSSMSQTRSGWHVTIASVSPYGYWTNSSFRMIGAWPLAFHAFIAAWMSGSSGPTSSPVVGAGSGAVSVTVSTTGTARARSSGVASVRFSKAQPARVIDQPPRATRPTARWRRLRDSIRRSSFRVASELLRPSEVRHVQPERVDENRVL